MLEIKTSEDIYRIIGLDESDVANAVVTIKKNGVMKFQLPISILVKLKTFLFPENPIDYDKTKDKIEIIIEG